jgi:hypothetical protein
MSEWAYRKCPKCGNRTHINCYCGECGGDPWDIERQTRCEIVMLEQDKMKYQLWISQIDEKLERLVKKLPQK